MSMFDMSGETEVVVFRLSIVIGRAPITTALTVNPSWMN